MIAQTVGTGIILSFIFTEIAGLSAGGLIVPGYLALFLTEPFRLIATFVVALSSYLIVKLLSNFIIIYSRRRFMIAILIGYLIGWLLPGLVPSHSYLGVDFRIIGYIVPGLIANDMLRQGMVKTIICTLLVAVLTRIIIFAIIK